MLPKVKIFNRCYPLVPFLATLIGVIILVMLGTWQIKRLGEKLNLINAIERQINSPARMITADNVHNLELFQKVKFRGRFIKGENIFLYGKRSATAEKDGYYILSPFIMTNKLSSETRPEKNLSVENLPTGNLLTENLNSDEILLVSRGWVPQSLKTAIDNQQVFLPDEEQIIEAIVMPGEGKRFFMPENDTNKNIWFRIDPKFAGSTHNVTVNDVYFRQINAENLPTGMMPLNTNSLSKIRNDHLEYAISWYSLAIALIVMFFIYYEIFQPGQETNS